jgi:hypothetical protein
VIAFGARVAPGWGAVLALRAASGTGTMQFESPGPALSSLRAAETPHPRRHPRENPVQRQLEDGAPWPTW